MACEICDNLTTEVAVREQKHVAIEERLAAIPEDYDTAIYRMLALDCDDARIDLQMARLELEKHMNSHARVT